MSLTLIISHGMNKTGFDYAAWLHTATARVLKAVQKAKEAERLTGGGTILWIGTAADDRESGGRTVLEAAMAQLQAAGDNFGCNLLAKATLDISSPNTAMECRNALTFALQVDQPVVRFISVSTPGHLARSLTDAMIAAAELAPQLADNVEGASSGVPFPHIDGMPAWQWPFIVDWVHVIKAPFVQAKKAWQWNVLFPALFMTFRGETPRYADFTEHYLVPGMRACGITHNKEGEEI